MPFFHDFSDPSDEHDEGGPEPRQGTFFSTRIQISRFQILDFLKARGPGSNTPLAEGPTNIITNININTNMNIKININTNTNINIDVILNINSHITN